MATKWGRRLAPGAVIAALIHTSMPLTGQMAPRSRTGAPVYATDPGIQVILERIADRSAAWRTALDSVASFGRMVLVVTPAEVIVADDTTDSVTDAFDPTSLAEAAPVVSADGVVNVVLAVVNIPLLQRTHAALGTSAADYESDLELLLIHEVFSHAVPYLLAGHMSGRCPDPIEGQRAVDACSIRRENVIRSELGLGKRKDYGLSGLVAGRAMAGR